MVFLPQPVQPVGHRLPTGIQIIICIQHDTKDCAPRYVDFHFDGIEQSLSLPSFSTITEILRQSAALTEVYNDVFVIRPFYKQYTGVRVGFLHRVT